MPLEELFAGKTTNEIISELKSKRTTAQPDAEQARKAIDPKLHDINNQFLRPDKMVRVDNPGDAGDKVIDAGSDGGYTRIEKVARVAVALQKLIINRAVSFTFGNPVAYNATPDGEVQ